MVISRVPCGYDTFGKTQYINHNNLGSLKVWWKIKWQLSRLLFNIFKVTNWITSTQKPTKLMAYLYYYFVVIWNSWIIRNCWVRRLRLTNNKKRIAKRLNAKQEIYYLQLMQFTLRGWKHLKDTKPTLLTRKKPIPLKLLKPTSMFNITNF